MIQNIPNSAAFPSYGEPGLRPNANWPTKVQVQILRARHTTERFSIVYLTRIGPVKAVKNPFEKRAILIHLLLQERYRPLAFAFSRRSS